ncbi:unnamed protein product, partial [marine sediment metagenome]
GKFYRSVGNTNTETAIQKERDQRLQQTSLDSLPTTTNRAS